MTDLYKILGVPKDATAQLITKAWRRLIKRYHPDRNVGDADAARKYAEVDEAYRILSNPDLRTEYDRTGEAPRRKSAPVDRETAELYQTLQPIVLGLLQQYDPTTAPLANYIRDALKDQIRQAEKHREAVERGRDKLRAATGRFSVAEGTLNVLADIIARQLEAVLAEHARITEELDKLSRVKAYLEKVSYAFSAKTHGDMLASALCRYLHD